MRIVGGELGGIVLRPPKGLPVRPTTERAKESLFNILSNQFDFEEITALDLFSGTGNITIELLSRGVSQVTSVEQHFGAYKFITDTVKTHHLTDRHQGVKGDVFAFLRNCITQFDFIFADPPYDLKKQVELPALVFDRSLLKPGGLLVIEHSTRVAVPHARLSEERTYGQSMFSFYRN